MTNLGPDFVRATQKGKSGTVIVHKSQLGAEYTAEVLTKEEEAQAVLAGRSSSVDPAAQAHEEASKLADNRRAADAKRAADERAIYEAASLRRRDQAALDAEEHGEVLKAAEEAKNELQLRRDQARRKSGQDIPPAVAADGRAPAQVDPDSVTVGSLTNVETMSPDRPPTSGETDARLEREARAIEERQSKNVHPAVTPGGHVTHPTHPPAETEKSSGKSKK